MIIEAPASKTPGSPNMLEKTAGASSAPAVDSPPAYTDVGSAYGHERQGPPNHPSSSGGLSQNYRTQNHHVQSHSPQNYPSQSYPSQNYPSQNYPSQSYPSQSYRARGPPLPRRAPGSDPVNLNTAKPAIHQVPAPTVDQVHIYDRKHDIDGTFYIDPLVQAFDQSRRAAKHKSKDELPHASFRTRHGQIDLRLATTGDGEKAPKAKVVVSSTTGLIKIALLPMLPSCPRMGLDVNSRHGNIVLFLPEGYNGVVQLGSRKGTIDVLPALASRMKVVKSSQREIIFMVGNAQEGVDTSREASFCEASTRSGNIIIGLSGRDHYAPAPGFWKRIGDLLRGHSSDTKLGGHLKS